MKVSYIVNCREEKREWFDIAIKSILAQKGVEKHIVLSTVANDPCANWMKKYSDYDYTEFIVAPEPKEDKGPPSSFWQLNNAIPFLRGDYVTFCSANDPLIDTKSINEIDTKGFPEFSRERHLKSNFIYDGSMVEMELFKKFMPFNLNWYNCGYWDLWLRVFESEGNVFCYNSIPTKFYIQHPESMHIKRMNNEPNKMRRNTGVKLMLEHHEGIMASKDAEPKG
jgi:hypothetical protein